MTITNPAKRRLALRATGLVGCAVLAWLSITVTMTRHLAIADPAAALRWSPRDAQALGLLAAGKLDAARSPALREDIGRMSMEALRRDPTIVAAARTLGLLSATEGRNRRAAALLDYAQALSRRDVATQLWFIQHSVAAGDLVGALGHFDVALRSSPSGEALLLPILRQAIDDPAVRAGLADRLATRPNWSRGFMIGAIRSAPSIDAVGALAIDLAHRNAPLDADLLDPLIGRLVKEGRYRIAASVQAASPGGVPIGGPWPHDGSFEHGTGIPPFGWVLRGDSALRAERASSGNGVAGLHLAFSSDPDAGGEVARQLLLLPTGRYTFSARFGVDGSDRLSRPFWRITCLSAGAAATRPLELDLVPARGSVAPPTDFTIPAGECDAQWLTLNIRPSQGIDGIDGWVDDVSIRPAR